MPDANRLSGYQPYVLSILRIVAALLFMQHGMQKLFGFPPGGHSHGPYVLLSMSGIAALLETFGGLALLLGLFTRPVAFILCGEMAVAFWSVHIPRGMAESWGLFPVVNGGDLSILFCFVYFYLIFAGGGAWSLDALVRGRAGRGA